MNTLATPLRAGLGTSGATAALGVTAIGFGLVPLFARELQASGADSATIAFYRYALSALLLLPFLPWARGKRREGLLMGAAGLFMGLSWIGYLDSLKVVSVGVAGVVYMTYPLFTLGFAWLLGGQKPGRRALLSAVLVIAAATVAFSPGTIPASAYPALVMALQAPLAFGFAIAVLCLCVPNLNALQRMAAAMLGSVIGLAPLVLANGPAALMPAEPGLWLSIIGVALVTALVPQLLYSFAAPRVGTARSAAAGSIELPTMFIVGWFAFGEGLGWRELLAAALVMSAVLLAPAIAGRLPDEAKSG